jgi:hypothetical protein
MRKALILFLLISLASGTFEIESVTVTISDIESDGSAKVQESIKFLIKGNFSKVLYDSGFQTKDDLSFWSNVTKLKDVSQHVNPAIVRIENFRLQPQPRSGCNPFLDMCHGELLFDYSIKPAYNNSQLINGTGLFSVDKYKPRTTRYSLDPAALAFTKTEGGNLILDPKVSLVVELPVDSTDVSFNPSATSSSIQNGKKQLSWSDMVLVQFSLIFEVEESIDKEVTKFFSDVLSNFQKTIRSQHGMSFLALIVILVGSYIYINISKKKREE